MSEPTFDKETSAMIVRYKDELLKERKRADKAEADVERLREEKKWLLREAIEYRKNAKEACRYAIVGEACLDEAIKWASE